MIDFFLNWINNTGILTVSDSLQYCFACVGSLIILLFILDVIKFLLYYISGRS